MLAGIDLGGTQVRVALARSDGNLIASIKTKTPLLPTPQALVDWAAAEIDKHRGREKVRSIALAAPGPIDHKRGVLVNPPNLPWRNVPFAAMLSRATGAKVHLANDADMAGLRQERVIVDKTPHCDEAVQAARFLIIAHNPSETYHRRTSSTRTSCLAASYRVLNREEASTIRSISGSRLVVQSAKP